LQSKSTYPLIESIIPIGKQLGMRLLAEGVETKDQLVSLSQMGFSGLLQGYLLSFR
jgi:EAL domain-containing protein (putative c-di-GMP-specific phosphodiesterase class I)